MIIGGALIITLIVSAVLLFSATMLTGQDRRDLEPGDGLTTEIGGQWPGTAFGGKYTTKLPCCSFEPEDLEDDQAFHHF